MSVNTQFKIFFQIFTKKIFLVFINKYFTCIVFYIFDLINIKSL